MARILVKEICREKGISLKTLAEQMGITPSALSQSLNTNPSIQTLERIAKTLQVNIADLLANDYPTIHGFVKTDNDVFTITSPEQWIETTNKIEGLAHIPLNFSIDKNRDAVKKFVIERLADKSTKSDGAIMAYLGASQVYCLSYDGEFKKFTLTMCNQEGHVDMQTFDMAEFSGKDDEWDTEDLIFMINSALENIYADDEYGEDLK